MKNRNMKSVVIKIASLLLIPVIGFTLLWGAFCVYANSLSEPPIPQIREAEFPFTLTYEINGTQKSVSDTLLCEYGGSVWYAELVEKTRTWTYKIKNKKKAFVLWTGVNRNGEKEEVHFCLSPEYYMGDAKKQESDFYMEVVTIQSDGEKEESIIDEDKLYKRYGVRILKWECAPPIQNRFE